MDILQDAGFRERVLGRAQKLLNEEISGIRSANCQRNAEAHYLRIWSILLAVRVLGFPPYSQMDSGEVRARLSKVVDQLLTLGMFSEAGNLVERELASILGQ